MTTSRFGINEPTEGVAGNAVTIARALRLHEALLCTEVLNSTLATPPGSPAEGDVYLVAASPTGAWTGWAGRFAIRLESAWTSAVPKGGQVVFDKNAKEWLGYSSAESAWHPMQKRWSTTEHWTGEYRSGKKVYAKVVNIGAPAAAGAVAVAHGISSIDATEHVGIECSALSASPVIAMPQPQYGLGLYIAFEIWVDATNVNVYSNGLDVSAFATLKARLTYCK